MPAALAVDWDKIRECAIAGMPYLEIAREWQMLDSDGQPTTRAIRARASREKWATPIATMDRAKRLMARAKRARVEALAIQPRVALQPGVTSGVASQLGVQTLQSPAQSALIDGKNQGGIVAAVTEPMGKDARDILAESAVTLGERSRMAILAGLTPQVVEAMTDAQTFKPRNVKELVQVGAMIHKLSGLDQSGNVAVNLNLWSDPARSNPALSGELYEVQDAQTEVIDAQEVE